MDPLTEKTIWVDCAMDNLIHKTIWIDKKEDSEKNTLIVRIERMQKFGLNQPPATSNCTIEIVSDGEDELGRPCKKRLKIKVDTALLSQIRDAASAIKQSDVNFRPSETTNQLRYEVESPLVVMWEVPPYETLPGKARYVIGNGEDIRFILGEFSDLEIFHHKLETTVLNLS
jgi:hypothetical protein